MADGEEDIFFEQESEIESLKYIFLEDLEIKEEKPYKFEVMLNANNESVEKNYLKLKLIFELPDTYPEQVPIVRIKNLTPDIIHNNKMLEFEKLVASKADENIGNPMIYEICEALREIISNMNELILSKLAELEEKDSIEHALKQFTISQDAPMTYTPVNEQTFGKWCDEFKEKMRRLKEESKSEKDLKLTGRQLFEIRKNYVEEIKIDEGDADDDEDFKDEGDDDDEDYEYDQALYEHEQLDDEDVDFE